MNSDTDRAIRSLSRRNWLKVTGAGVAAGLAGCSSKSTDDSTTGDGSNDGTNGNGNGNDNTGGNDGGGTPKDAWYTIPASSDVARKDTGFNPFNPQSKAIALQSTMEQNLMELDTKKNEFLPRIVKDVKIDGTTMTATLSDKYGWSNGKPITAKDLETQFTLYINNDYSVGDFVKEVTAKDDKTAEFTLTGEANPTILKQRVFLSLLELPHQVFGDYAKRYKNAGNDDEKKKITKDLQGFEISFDSNTDKIITSGPVKFSDVNNKRVAMTPNKHHPHGKDINYKGVEFLWVKDSSTAKSLLKSNNIDTYEESLSTSFISSLKSEKEVWKVSQYGGNSIDFYLQDDLYDDASVRQAFNYILNQKQMVKATGYPLNTVKYYAGSPDQVIENYIPKDTLAKFPSYEQNFDKASKLLKEAGFTKNGKKWMTPGGKEWKPAVGIASGSNVRIKETKVAQEQFRNFGVKLQMNIKDSSEYWKSVRERDYRIGTYAWGDRGHRHPYFDYDYMWIGHTYNDQDEAWNGLDHKVKVPGTVGKPNSKEETWNIRKMASELGTTQSDKRQKELITKLAWMYNQYLPKLPIDQSTVSVVMTRDDWQFPSKEAYAGSRSADGAQPLLREGKLRAKTK